MKFQPYVLIPIALVAVLCAVLVFVLVLVIRALQKYLRSEPVRTEKVQTTKSLGEVLKGHRQTCKMTQEFVAETLGVSRQAVSKWENGSADPSTSNLLALAKLYGTTAEELLQAIRGGKAETNAPNKEEKA